MTVAIPSKSGSIRLAIGSPAGSVKQRNACEVSGIGSGGAAR